MCFASWHGSGQPIAPVAWHFDAQPLNANETTVVLQATLAPGWHIYSQQLAQGGPIPTRFRFDTGNDVVLEATTLELGDAHTFHDSLYEMDVTWYSGSVVFQQRIRLLKRVKVLSGTVQYMTCNNEICIPAEKEFSIPLTP
jgi:DsbC/DsbD-like thiol-disulfide interchange protein